MLQVEATHARACGLEAWSESKEPLTELMRREFDEWLASELPKAAALTERGAAMRSLLSDRGL